MLTGSNGGRFKPDDTIRRSEAAAILTRMAVPSLRQKVEISTGEQPENVLSADEILEKCGPAVFKLTSYDARGNLLGMGSGVVLSANGDAVTCGHLVNGVARLVAEMADGSKREVSIYALDARLRHRAYPRRRCRSAVSGDCGQLVHGRHRVRARLSGRRRGKR